MKALIPLLIFFFFIMNVSNETEGAKEVRIAANQSIAIKSSEDIEKIAIGSGKIASVVQVPHTVREFLIVGKEAGRTNLYVWTKDGRKEEYEINVLVEDEGLATQIENAIGLAKVKVRKVDDRILLTGEVENQYERNYALQIARLYVGGEGEINVSVGSGPDVRIKTESASGNRGTTIQLGSEGKKESGKVIDLLEMKNPTQVRLEVQVIAIRPTDRENLGIHYGNDPSEGPGVFLFGESHGSGTPFRNNPVNWALDRHAAINLQVQALITKNKAKLLSRPSIMTLGGEEALIQVGGEIPYTVYVDGEASVQFKNYGIILQMKPIVDKEGRITSSVHAEVSSMTGETVNGQPILSIRRADSVVTMHTGETIVIGGLLDSSEQKHVTKIPLLGDIPILGEFFKYTSKTKEKQELIIMVTPHVVKGSEARQTRMTEEMEEYYRRGKRERDAMKEVDVHAE